MHVWERIPFGRCQLPKCHIPLEGLDDSVCDSRILEEERSGLKTKGGNRIPHPDCDFDLCSTQVGSTEAVDEATTQMEGLLEGDGMDDHRQGLFVVGFGSA